MTGSQSTVETASEPATSDTEPETPMTSETIIQTGTKSSSTDSTETTTSRTEIDDSPSTCTECGSSSITVSDKHAETSCDDCGAIIESRDFPQTAGWKHESSEKHKRDTSVTGNDDSGISMNPLGGTIDWKDMDGYGSSLSSKKRSRMHRLRNHDRNLDSGEPKRSNYKYALGEINRIAAAISVPRHVRDSASELYEEILEEDALRGRSIEATATAVLYAACEQKNFDRPLSELAEVSHADHSEVADTYTGILKDLGMNDHGVDVTTYVPSLCDHLTLDDDVQSVAAEILEHTVTEELLENGSLVEHTAAAVYAAAVRTNEKVSQKQISKAANVDQAAIRSRYQEQVEAAAFNTAQ